MLNDRQTAILSYITEHTKARNRELMALMGECSVMTLWRDLERLEQEGLIVRVRGGAVSAQDAQTVGRETSFAYRARQNITAKEAIARLAAPLLHPSRACYLDAGSTILTLTRLMEDGNFTVLTSAANTAAELVCRSQYSVTLLGGQMYGSTLSCSGPQAEAMLDGMNIDVAVMATSGFSLSGGFTSGYLPEAQLKRKIIAKSALTIMLMDTSKIGRSHPFTFAALEEMDVLILDSQPPRELCDALAQSRVLLFTPGDGHSPEERDRLCRECLRRKRNI